MSIDSSSARTFTVDVAEHVGEVGEAPQVEVRLQTHAPLRLSLGEAYALEAGLHAYLREREIYREGEDLAHADLPSCTTTQFS